MKKIQALLEAMWVDYLELNPEARSIYQLFTERNNGDVVNDHIALRTFNIGKVCIDVIAQPFIQSGYVASGEYHFEEKKLFARHYQHENSTLPKIFISELLVDKLSQTTQKTISDLVGQLDDAAVKQDNFCFSGRPWQLSYASYQQLLLESEYAAWMAAFGYRPNHFTVLVNELTFCSSLELVNQLLVEKGFSLNQSGGLIKGTPALLLEQSSTMANNSKVTFSDQDIEVPSCYYEFARRYPQADSMLYQGFISSSADKIFESTNSKLADKVER
ncbi:MAG: hypothetical protein ACJAUP_001736 [Cellvibrionaceae bacterium]